MHCRQGRVHPRAVIGLLCATHDIASGVTKISPVLGAVLMKLDEGWQDGHWHPKAGEGLCSGVPQMWENQLSTHRDPQSPPAVGSATLLHSCPSALGPALCMHCAPHAQHPDTALCLGCVGSPVAERDPWGSTGQPWLTSV